MADTTHLLYLLPDVAYAVELVPGKEAGSFVIRDYLQVNGEFMNEDELLAENLGKLAGKLPPRTYDVVLPDFLFTNTVVNVGQTGEEAVKRYVHDTLMPSLEISDDSHQTQIFVLTEFKGTSKAQLAAVEKSLLEPLRAAFGGEGQASLRQVYPLSWTLKSLISLEPSISVVQLGARLYLAQHYIGVDQANEALAEDAEKLIETVKTLKGAEPSIQTLYLVTSPLVEKKLRDGLKETLPLQQLADNTEESEMPQYVKYSIEAGAKTVAIPEYTIPAFAVGVGVGTSSTVTAAPTQGMLKTVKEPDASDMKDKSSDAIETPEVVLPVADEAELPSPAEPVVTTSTDEPELEFADQTQDEVPEAAPAPVDLTQFSSHEQVDEQEAAPAAPVVSAPAAAPSEPAAPKKVIKNDSGVNGMVRMIFIGLVSFFVTVGIGLGIGLGLLSFTSPTDTPPVDEPSITEITPTTEPTPTPTPEPEIDRTEETVLVVNATARAGYAGQIANRLEAAGFESVTARNAVGDYETGNFVLLEEANLSLVNLLSSDTELTLVFSEEEKTVEDPNGTYTIVIVLAE